MLEELKEKLRFEKILLKIKVVPKSSRHEIQSILEDGTIKMRLRSAPENNKANEELISLLSEFFKISPKYITIVKGQKSRSKTVEIYPKKSASLSKHSRTH
jgi:uncharacterized protein (TIGR00251 family)